MKQVQVSEGVSVLVADDATDDEVEAVKAQHLPEGTPPKKAAAKKA